MNVVITGGGGFLGSQLAIRILREAQLQLRPQSDHCPVEQLTVADLCIPGLVRDKLSPFGARVRTVEGDLASPLVMEAALAPLKEKPHGVLFHLASVISGDGERDFDLAMRVNLDGTRSILEFCRHLAPTTRVVFASSLATFGGHALESVVSDKTKQIPQTTYGMTKLMGELMINDYSRKGFLDGRAVRLPTIFIRPGLPNSAASSFASSLFREPLNGEPCTLPVHPDQRVPLLSYVQTVEAFVRICQANAELLGDDRTLTLPSTTYVIAEMVEALQAYAEKNNIELGPIRFEPDPRIVKIVSGWPVATESERAEQLGIHSDRSLSEVIDAYRRDFL